MAMLEETYIERFREFEHFWQAGDYYGAAQRLAELSHCVPSLAANSRSEWSNRIQTFASSISKETGTMPEKGLLEDSERIRRILSIGNKWVEEEILLVLGIRIEIELLRAFLNERCSYEVAAPLALAYIDEQLVELSKSKEHERHFRWAIDMMKKNWGLPIESKWLRLPAT